MGGTASETANARALSLFRMAQRRMLSRSSMLASAFKSIGRRIAAKSTWVLIKSRG